ncbi:polyisoprenoid-binding protein YceI [Kitasatospora sp. GP30]|uniref:YceI family protein n=1 Tax=Kitasatospora sp. GP30 TaxID=3035084 RepID=UPI000C6FFF62|nr:YceI family protein [Kitasatospora sp. GP30]MDH6143748.1 polyisoprenoid-binding protein YceI [Kitasatospora sp. GP30]
MTTATPAPGCYAIDVPRSEITFVTKHMFGLGTVRGSFRLRGGTVSVTEPLTGSRVDAVADAASFDTGNSNRDRKVLSKALLDTAGYPDIAFSSTGAELTEAGAWALQGLLTAHGVRAPVTFTVARAGVDGDEIDVEATATVDRYAHGVTRLKGVAGRRLRLTASIRARRTGDVPV